MFKRLLITLIITASMVAPAISLAAYNPQEVTFDPNNNAQRNTGLGNASPTDVAAGIIQRVLTILALLALILMIYAGFVWMLSRGKEEDVERAKEILYGALFGLIVILASYGLSLYVFENLINITNA
ncbi:MAG: hypothetical protein HYV33_06165 [Candidatus Kerfeldbacteria bacterium]|nr:hypothetical protein [Candidatus Kerfeldbacteria bacterium]